MRRRLLAAILIIATNLFLLAWVDDQLLLRNPIELDTRARLILKQLFPDQNPKIDHIEVDFSSRRVIAQGLEFFEKTTQRSLLQVDRVEATLSLTDWLAPREVIVQGVRGHLRLRGDHLNIEDLVSGADTSKSAPTRTSAVAVSVEDVRIDFEDESNGSHSLAVCEHAELQVQADGRVTGTGRARAGALVTPDSPFAAGGTPVEGQPGLLYREIVQKLDFEIDRRADGRTSVPVFVEHVSIGPLLRSLLPPYVQNVIWAELNPEGIVDANVNVTLGVKSQGPHFSITLNAKNAAICPKKFPYPITDINGRFEVAVGNLPIVSWEEVTAKLAGDGRVVKARGSFFLGEDDEHVSLFIFIDAKDIPFDDTLHAAIPADIRQVYDQFGIKGLAGPSKVIIFKGPFMEEPQLSIRSTVDGRQSAAFLDYPVRLTAEKGTFTLREGGNVEVDAEGTLEGGGKAHVDARVVHGDLIHVHVNGDHVLVTQPLLAKLDEPVRRMIEPFRPRGGEMGFDLVVEKSDPAGAPHPRATVQLKGVTVAPDIFPYRMKTDGTVAVRPLYDDSKPGRKGLPEIQVDLDLTANANAIAAAVISGSVVLDPQRKDTEFRGALTATCQRLDADPELRHALPAELRKIVERLAPEGSLRDVKANVRSLRSFDAEGVGQNMTTALDSFPYRVALDSFAIRREDRVVTLKRVEGKTPGGGTYTLAGTVEMPPDGASADPFVQVGVSARRVAIDKALLAALPGDARASLERLSPSGGALDASLRVALAPALGLDLTGNVDLSGTKVFLDKLDPSLEGLAGIPVEDVNGRLRLDGARVWIDGLRARFRGAPVSAGGSIAMAVPPSQDGIAPSGSSSLLDLVAHVDGLLLDEPTRKLARGPVAQALGRFPVEGRCDLDFRLLRRTQEDPRVDVRVRPRGVRVVPKILPFDFEDVNGTIDVTGGEAARVELTARLGRAAIEVRRDKRLETFVEPGTSVFTVRAKGIHPEELARAPEDFARTVEDFDIKGAVDLDVSVAIPPDERAKQHFVAELRTSDFSVTSGIRFENARGMLRVAGSVAKFEPLELEGSLALDHAEWKKQELTGAHIPVRLRDGLLSIGTVNEPFVGDFYAGQLRGRVQSNLKTGVYTGSLYLQGGELGVAAQQLSRLAEKEANAPLSGGTAEPMRGELTTRLDFQGGGTSPDGRPIGLSGEAVLLAQNANLVRVPFLFGGFVDIVRGATHGDSSYDPKAFDRLYTKLHLRPSRIDIELFQLASDTLTLRGSNGELGWDGEIKLDLLPFKTGAVFDEIFKQFVGVSVRGTVQHPETHEMPFYNGIDKIWNALRSAFSSSSTERVGESQPGK